METVARAKPHVALVNIALQNDPVGGLVALQDLQLHAARTHCILLLDKHDKDIIVEAFRRGARGAFVRDASCAMLRNCIQVVREGQIWITTADLCGLLKTFSAAVPLSLINGQGHELLTKREREIVSLVMQGRPSSRARRIPARTRSMIKLRSSSAIAATMMATAATQQCQSALFSLLSPLRKG